ncbi:helix-turn-helix transcriptional regulator [Coprococcus eutactus]|jgi:transcriptional regulator with XRE-family HTH domain|nr:helix-turn-helix transcriptional regulator [Coprococcus eutactus]RHV78190.1 XRE family transcriptional regulator [Clostridium sp. OF10-22XD]DAE57556.1 MAG TPA: Repressor protein CI [Caudoviricetes sp.]DAU86328.1 MAG TPA: Repressor protein CI [Caudoviricetes sp.]
MPYEEFNKLFAKNLRYYLNKNNMTQAELAKRLNVGTTSVYNWCNGIKSPRMDKVDAMCDIFNCKRSNLIEDKEHVEENEYYLDPETAKKAQEIFENKQLSLLFDAARDAEPEDLETVHTMLMALKNKEKR